MGEQVNGKEGGECGISFSELKSNSKQKYGVLNVSITNQVNKDCIKDVYCEINCMIANGIQAPEMIVQGKGQITKPP